MELTDKSDIKAIPVPPIPLEGPILLLSRIPIPNMEYGEEVDCAEIMPATDARSDNIRTDVFRSLGIIILIR